MSRKIIFEAIIGSQLYGINREDSDTEFLRSILNKEYHVDFFTEINQKIDELRLVNSPLPNNPNWSKINILSAEMLREHILKEI